MVHDDPARVCLPDIRFRSRSEWFRSLVRHHLPLCRAGIVFASGIDKCRQAHRAIIVRILILGIAVLGWQCQLVADENAKMQVIAKGLNNPCGVAIEPKSGTLFVSESGKGRVIALRDGKSTRTCISGFAIESYGNGPAYNIGPMGLAITDDGYLLVGEGGRTAGNDRLMAFKVADIANNVAAEEYSSTVSLPAMDAKSAEGNFYGVTSVGRWIFTTCHGDDSKGWIARAQYRDGQITEFDRFIATKEIVSTDAPTAIANEIDGFWVSQFGETNVKHDAVVLKFNRDGKPIGKYYTGLSDITGIAICPRTSRVFVVDFSWIDATAGGLFELVEFDDSTNRCSKRKILSLMRPTAMAFGNDGTLWVTEVGESVKDKPNGRLLKINNL